MPPRLLTVDGNQGDGDLGTVNLIAILKLGGGIPRDFHRLLRLRLANVVLLRWAKPIIDILQAILESITLWQKICQNIPAALRVARRRWFWIFLVGALVVFVYLDEIRFRIALARAYNGTVVASLFGDRTKDPDGRLYGHFQLKGPQKDAVIWEAWRVSSGFWMRMRAESPTLRLALLDSNSACVAVIAVYGTATKDRDPTKLHRFHDLLNRIRSGVSTPQSPRLPMTHYEFLRRLNL